MVPIIVVGAGGYVDLHPIGDPRAADQHPALRNVSLERFCDNHFGFLRFGAVRKDYGLSLTAHIIP